MARVKSQIARTMMRVKCPKCEREMPIACGAEVVCSCGERFSVQEHLAERPWCRTPSHLRMPFGPVGIPKDVWDRMFEELDPVIDDDGTELKRYKLINFGGVPVDGPVCTQVNMSKPLPPHEIAERKPLEAPSGSVFFLDYTYGGKDPLDEL